MKIHEHRLEPDPGIENRSEDRRRARRPEEVLKRCESEGRVVSALVTTMRRASQCGVNPIRCLRKSLRERVAEVAAVLDLEASCAQS